MGHHLFVSLFLSYSRVTREKFNRTCFFFCCSQQPNFFFHLNFVSSSNIFLFLLFIFSLHCTCLLTSGRFFFYLFFLYFFIHSSWNFYRSIRIFIIFLFFSAWKKYLIMKFTSFVSKTWNINIDFFLRLFWFWKSDKWGE